MSVNKTNKKHTESKKINFATYIDTCDFCKEEILDKFKVYFSFL